MPAGVSDFLTMQGQSKVGAWVKTASASTAERINQKTRISANNSAAGNVKPNQPTMSARDFSTLWE